MGEGFGANRFDVADGPMLSFDSHSDYWNHDGRTPSDSLDNMADIVSGHMDQVRRQEQR
ncbi:hypothetical protein ACFYS8_14850 [Kitasatospora sp. NPDC004615]|uniref:hypothetical protein n=1 Tax=Kitasatospora sp. NPDC004615 TaxID=3364017 RepID=UPI00369503CB